MSGSKTKYGFTGGEDTPDPEEVRSARTVPGHDVHLQMPPDLEPPQFPVARTPVPPEPEPLSSPSPRARATPVRPTVRVDELDESDPRRRQHRPQPSRLARFLGRWTKSGHFLSNSRMAMKKARTTIRIPRDATGRNVLLVLLVAFFTFIVTLSVVRMTTIRMRQNVMKPSSPPAAPASVATQPAPPAALPPPLQTQPLVEVSPPPPDPVPPSAKGLGTSAQATGARRAHHAGQPVARPPAHLKDELLPLNPSLEP